jgi:FkbM family methyltransferase
MTVFEILNKFHQIILIDIGCNRADWVTSFSPNLTKPIYTVGVDPQDYNVKNCYAAYHSLAISNVSEPTTLPFNVYDEGGCSSLKKLRLDKLTNDRSQEGWFCNHNITFQFQRDVKCIRASQLFREDPVIASAPIIHFVKIDTQGSDLNVIKSMDEFIPRVMFIQMESLVKKNASSQMYEEQGYSKEDIAYMVSQGFRVFDIKDHSEVSCPEADIIFFNTRMSDIVEKDSA